MNHQKRNQLIKSVEVWVIKIADTYYIYNPEIFTIIKDHISIVYTYKLSFILQLSPKIQ